MEKGEAAWRADMTAKVAKLFAAEIAAHFEVEEAILFPEMERLLGPLELVTKLREEHQTLRGLVKRLSESLNRLHEPGGLRDLSTLDEFSGLLEAHVRREERQLFPAFEKKIPADVAARLGREIEARLVKACPRG